MNRWLAVILVGFSVMGTQAQNVVKNDNPGATNDVKMLMFHGIELFEMAPVSSISADERTKTLMRKLTKIAKSPLISTKDLTLHHDDALKVSLIMNDGDMICAVWETDAEYHQDERRNLAEHWHGLIQSTIDQYRKDRTTEALTKSGIYALVSTLIFLIIWLLVRMVCKKEIAVMGKKFGGQKMFKFLDGDTIVMINGDVIKIVRFVFMLWIFILYLNLVLSFFPWTYNLSAKLFSMVSMPVVNFGHAFVAYLPSLFALIVIIIITMLVLRSLKSIFEQIDQGRVRVRGFYRDWANPTYRLVRIFVIIFAAVVAFPFIPGSGSPAFKGISIFMGVLFSLGSTSAVGNVISGLMLTYMRPFVDDDFVEISGMRGTVESRGTFSTRLKTQTNEIISIPNASVSSNHIINFSRMAERGGVRVGTAITIGYDVPWRKVHELLLASAEGVEDVLQAPPPKVLQLSLDDFYVQYKLIVTTKHPERRFMIRSNLHQNIQDNFSKAEVEIMSPHYQDNRNGEDSTIPGMDAFID